MKRWWLSLFIVVPSLIFVGVEGRIVNDSSFEQTKEMTLLRNIGHLVLLSSGDRSSRVLPVEEIAKGNYLIRFEKPFMPVPDSLVSIFTSNFNSQYDYAVEIKQCESDSIVYSFVISSDSARTLLPCLERGMPEDCYQLVIRLSDKKPFMGYYLAGLVLLLLLVGGWVYLRKRPASNSLLQKEDSRVMSIGRFQFYISERKLELDGRYTELTGKECQLLAILAQSPNTVVDRDRLQKEIWEDEGIIVTRSLDMFISKLRKKLKDDPYLRIVNVHGKGYKLLTMI